ncbi:MAG: GTP-binding protein [Candidatus Jordarchaeum sp.]|uniref:GTP-binding protein n=1 Tax=Candidatus Jordarchaeum sp. TaxID=2823881 RepID=UPI00404B2A1B
MEADNFQSDLLDGRLLQIKIVFWGPASSGKTTNIRALGKLFPNNVIGVPYEVSTSEGRTIWEDYLALQLEFPPYCLVFHVHTTTGQKRFLATREQIARNADGVLFVADSQEQKLDDNMRSLEELIAFTENKIPVIVEANKQDLPNAMSAEKLGEKLGVPEGVQIYPASAIRCEGVYEVFRGIIRLVIKNRTT